MPVTASPLGPTTVAIQPRAAAGPPQTFADIQVSGQPPKLDGNDGEDVMLMCGICRLNSSRPIRSTSRPRLRGSQH